MALLVQLTFLVALVLVVIGLLAARRMVFARMAVRNIARRKKFSAIVVVGLLTATAMISAALVVRDIIDEAMTMSASIMQLMEMFLGVGLIVGISGLGIITIRNVAERRQEIGVMRAIGFQRNMILNVFLLETSFVALLGIAMGVVLGLLLSYKLFDWGGFSEISEFVIPWGEVRLVLAIAFTVTMMATLPPSRRAARLAPAEALRRVD